jgi:hypothetical protein
MKGTLESGCPRTVGNCAMEPEASKAGGAFVECDRFVANTLGWRPGLQRPNATQLELNVMQSSDDRDLVYTEKRILEAANHLLRHDGYLFTYV